MPTTMTSTEPTNLGCRAIAKYLVQKFAEPEKRHLYPADIAEQALVDRILCFDQGILYQSICNYYKPQPVYEHLPNPILGAEIERSLQLLEKILGKNTFVLGGVGGTEQLTIADLSVVATLSKLESMDYCYDRYEILSKYVQFLKGYVTSYQECCQKGIDLTKEWNRKNLNHTPRYISQSSVGQQPYCKPSI